ncbi:MAG TPA: hypothetical protein VKR82_05900 [Candidatus Acidoferrales bacterium]|nr:hypothetical protein [Candidatus Acidoferrales bacterium]
MTLFDLVFLASFLITVAVLAMVGIAALRRQWPLLRKLLIGWAVFATVYFGAMIAVSLASPQRVLSVGENRCWDDFCIAVMNVQRRPASHGNSVDLTLRLSSTAKRVMQRENGVGVYLIDNRGNRYEANPVTTEIPLNVQLGPGDSVETLRVFQVPLDAHGLALGFTHSGPGYFIIGDDGSFFHKPTVIRIE